MTSVEISLPWLSVSSNMIETVKMYEWIERLLLSIYSKSWPSVKRKKKERRKIEWLLISFRALGRRPSLREERSNAIKIGEKCQGEKNKYNFFFSFSPFPVRFFFDQYERKTTIPVKNEHIWQVIESLFSSILFHVPLGQMAADTRPTS